MDLSFNQQSKNNRNLHKLQESDNENVEQKIMSIDWYWVGVNLNH